MISHAICHNKIPRQTTLLLPIFIFKLNAIDFFEVLYYTYQKIVDFSVCPIL